MAHARMKGRPSFLSLPTREVMVLAYALKPSMYAVGMYVVFPTFARAQ